MKYPLASIIIPVYNVEPFVARCLDSVMSQTLRDIEIIVVNDGSDDSSLDIVMALADQDARITVISRENGGLAAARNTGLEHANGEFLAFVDGDDAIAPQMLETLSRIARQDDADIVQCGYVRVNEKGESVDLWRYTGPINFTRLLGGELPRAMCFRLYRRRLFEANLLRFPDGLLHEDLSISVKLFYFANRISWCTENFYCWYQRGDSISATISEKHIDNVFSNFEDLVKFLTERHLLPELEKELVRGCFAYVANLFDRVLLCERLDEPTRSSWYDYLEKRMRAFRYTHPERISGLRTFDRDVFLKINRVLIRAGRLLPPPDQETLRCQRQARMYEFLKANDPESYKLCLTNDFVYRLRKLQLWIGRLCERYTRIALYGLGTVGAIIAPMVGHKLVVIADRRASDPGLNSQYPVCLPENLPAFEADCVVVTVFGDERSVRNYLTTVVGVPYERIFFADLTGAPL